MQETPQSERLHIGIFGRRNSGKSSLVNALTGQETSLVSQVPGTTTDPVKKAMEIPGIGPCLFIDTPGFDDYDDNLGGMRVERTMKALERTDIALLVCTDVDSEVVQWYNSLRSRSLPVIPVLNIFETAPGTESVPDGGAWVGRARAELRELTGEEPILVNARTGRGKEEIFKAILRKLPQGFGELSITGDLASAGDTVLLVMPQDSLAPKGRLILPQVQTIRELLDKGCTAVGCTADRISQALAGLSAPPDLIVTDSQAFAQAWAAKPKESRLTSFSILYAGYKGDLSVFLKGAEALAGLKDGAHVLIAEACTHAPASEDIGRVKIPNMLRKRVGPNVKTTVVAGSDFPEDLSPYDLVIHCGACMFNRKYVLSRIASAQKQGVPITNYGMALAWANELLDKVAIPARQ